MASTLLLSNDSQGVRRIMHAYARPLPLCQSGQPLTYITGNVARRIIWMPNLLLTADRVDHTVAAPYDQGGGGADRLAAVV